MSFFSRLIDILLTPIRVMLVLFSRLIPGLKKVTRISLPARLALLSFLALLITGIAVMIHFRLMGERYKDWPDWITDWRLILLVVACVFLVPACIYFAVDLLLKGESSKYPDIDNAWSAGMAALRDHGIDITTTPLFLVVGAGSDEFASRLHTAAGLKAAVNGVSSGAKPIQWFADQDYVFLHVSGASSLSQLAKKHWSSMAAGSSGGEQNTPVYMKTIRGDAAAAAAPASSSGTMAGAPQSDEASSPAPPARPNIMGTLVKSGGDDSDQPPAPRAEITQQELEMYTDRLDYVCHLLRKHRHPVCPTNGVVTLLPFESIENFHDQVQLALHEDLTTIAEETRMRFPVTVLITHTENEVGFKEFMRRFSKEEIERGRIGSKYGNADSDVWTPPTADRTRHLAQSACKNIEDNIRQFYSREDALQRPGNGKLFTLLTKIRGVFGKRIEALCANGLADPKVMIVGCYFVAAGKSPDQQGFVQSVIRDKVIGNRGKLAWDERVIRQNQAYLTLSNLFALIAVVTGAALVYMLVRDLFF